MAGLRRTPADVRAVPRPGERAIAWGRDARGDPVVVTALALYLPRPMDDHLRIAFETVAAASWEDPVLVVALVGADRRTYRIRLDDPGEIPPTVRERVTASIVISERLLVDGRLGARFTARRPPGGDEELTWSVLFDPGLDPADPTLRRWADAAIAELRASRGV